MLFFYSWSVCDLLIHAEKCWNKWNDPNLALAVQLLCLSSPGLPAVLAAQQAPTWTLCSLTCCSLPCWRKNLCWAMAWTWGSILCNILNSWVRPEHQEESSCWAVSTWSPATHSWWQVLQAAEPSAWCMGWEMQPEDSTCFCFHRTESRDNYMGDQDWRLWSFPASLSAIFRRSCARKVLSSYCSIRACFSLHRFLLSISFPQ